MLEGLKIELYKVNSQLVKDGLVLLKWGNVSARDPESGNVVIKPRGMAMEKMQPMDMIVCDPDGKIIEGRHDPSSDLLTHLALYKSFENVHSIVHTHSKWATVFAQAHECIPSLGTTHADRFKEDIPLTRGLEPEEIATDYYTNIGKVIVEAQNGQNPLYTPAALVRSHGPFTWGSDITDGVENAIALEFIADMAYHTLRLATDIDMNEFLIEEHSRRQREKRETIFG